MRVGILTDYPSPAVQSGPAIHTRFLSEGLTRRGHGVTFMGPDTGGIEDVNGAADFLFPAVPYPTHPAVKVGMPGSPARLFSKRPPVDVIHGQANSHMLHYGVWAREMWGIPFLNTHIIHLPTHSHFILSDRLYQNDTVRDFIQSRAESVERNFAENIYNHSDCFIVQSRYMVDYWRKRGVTTPIEVVGRPINPGIFSRRSERDPFPATYKAGHRLLVVCRHDREKNLHRLIDIFAREIAPRDPHMTLTIVGDGHDHLNLVRQAEETDCSARIFFPGEASHEALVDWYAHADLFVYTSVSETFGNVVNEALWCGVPAVAFDDQMGVAGQVVDGVNGALIDPNDPAADLHFAEATLSLIRNRDLRRQLGGEAANLSRRTAHPDVVLGRFEKIYENAARHRRETLPVPLVQRNRAAQMAAFARHYGAWGFWNGLLLTIANTATRLGASRSSSATQHTHAPALELPAAAMPAIERAAEQYARAPAA